MLTVPVNVDDATWFAVPVNVEAVTVPLGVIESDPAVFPTSPFALIVPRMKYPLSADTSVKPVGHAAASVMMMTPEVKPGPAAPVAPVTP